MNETFWRKNSQQNCLFMSTTKRHCFVTMAVVILLVTFMQQTQAKVIRTRRNNPEVLDCLEVSSRCRNNSTCATAYRAVKRKCKVTAARCNAPTRDQPKCADNIDILRATFFPVDNKCRCFGVGLPAKKLIRCKDIKNSVYANPCFEHGRFIAARLARTTTFDTRTHYVTGRSDLAEINHSGVTMPTDYRKTDDVTRSDDAISTSQSHLEVMTSSISDTTLSESEYQEIDNIFADEYDLPEGSDVKNNNRNENNARVDVDGDVIKKGPDLKKSQTSATERNVPIKETGWEQDTSIAVENTRTSYVLETHTLPDPRTWHIVLIACGGCLLIVVMLTVAYIMHQRRNKTNYSAGTRTGNPQNVTVVIQDEEVKLPTTENQL